MSHRKLIFDLRPKIQARNLLELFHIDRISGRPFFSRWTIRIPQQEGMARPTWKASSLALVQLTSPAWAARRF
jgi:hypothetical protein